MTDLAGASIGPYRVLERLGRGGMADVYKALHTRLDVHRAIKFIRPEFVGAADFRARFEKEAQAVAQLRHPNIVQVHDFGEHGDAYYMVMEYVDGRSLDDLVAAEGAVRPVARAVGLVRQVAAALDYAHRRGLIHRDVKPQNVMLTGSGQAILMDFGIARLAQDAGTRLTQTGAGIGTPAYMAPEQALGAADVGPAADIYALCVLLYELLTGRVPFSAETPIAAMLKAIRDPFLPPRALSPDIGEALQAVILKGTAKQPGDRYPTAGALDAALAAALERDAAAARSDDAPAIMRPGVDPEATLQRIDPITLAPAAAAPVARGPVSARPVRAVATATALVFAACALGFAAWAWWSRAGRDAPAPAAVTAAVSAAPDEAAASRAFAFDRPVTGALSGAAAPVEYGFDATAGETFYLDRIESANGTMFTLRAPDGTALFDSAGDAGPSTLAQTGRHRLLVSGPPGVTAPFRYVLWRLPEPEIDAGTIDGERPVDGRTQRPGQMLRFHVDGIAGRRVAFELVEASAPAVFRLIEPMTGTELFATGGSAGPVRLPVTGRYALVVDPEGDQLARVRFALKVVPDARAVAARPPQPPPPGTLRAAMTGPDRIVRGVTRQSEIRERFGEPNMKNRDRRGNEVWLYRRALTPQQAEAWNDSSARGGAGPGAGGAPVAATMVTVTVTFAPDSRVLDWQLRRRAMP